MLESLDDEADPQFSLVVAVYDVDRFLPEFLGGLDRQTLPSTRFEVVLVDDGSTDDSLTTMRAWAAATALDVTVLTQANGGQSSARNLGLTRARGEWVSFPDPDDVLRPDYLDRVADALSHEPSVDSVAANLVLRMDATGTVVDNHPLRHRFEGAARVRDLEDAPGFFFVSAPAGFYRRDRVESLGLRFDTRIRPNFEDGHFAGRYLLASARPSVLFVPDAVYEYRKRGDGTSTLDQGLFHPGRYTDVLRYGYLDLLQRAAQDRGTVPRWLSLLLMYEFSWLLTPSMRARSVQHAELVAVQDEFHDLMADITELLDPDVGARFSRLQLQPLWRDVLRQGWRGQAWTSDLVRITRVDPDQGLLRLSYHYTGEAPVLELEVNGAAVAAAYWTRRPFEMFGRVLMHEHIVWVPFVDGLRVRLGGEEQTLRVVPAGIDLSRVEAGPIDEHVRRVGRARRTGRLRPRRRVQELARLPGLRRRFRDAWVLIDRIHDADDSGQRLFEHLRAERPDVNAWFVVERDTAAWRELRPRFGRRVVAYGSLGWKLLMCHARHVISSHADAGVWRPSEVVALEDDTPWRFTFLQHGVIKDDLSSWLNPKNLDLFVTSTQAEHRSIVAKDSNYTYTERETVLTGLPRFDRLLRLGDETPPEERSLLLVCPTWRQWLTAPAQVDSQRRTVTDDFLTSEFATAWLDLLRSPVLAAAAQAHGLTVAFLPHPNLEKHLDGVDLPPHVQVIGFEGTDVQRVFARGAAMITDYSSMAFNAAYLDRPVVYYQFDSDRMFGGEHVGVGGYFDYHRDGFGPVARTHAEVETAVEDLVGRGVTLEDRYRARIAAAFPDRDGRCCERVVDAIEASTQRHAPRFV